MPAAALQIATAAAPAAPSALRGAVVRLERSTFAPARAGVDLARVLPGARYWRPLLAAGLLEERGARVLLTAEGLAAVGACSSCTWASCSGRCAQPAAPAPARRRLRIVTATEAPPVAATVDAPEVHASTLPIVLGRGPASAGQSLKGERRRQGDLYRQRAARALFGAVRAWERTFCTTIEAGADIRSRLLGRRRYWQAGLGAGWIHFDGQAVRITAEGIAAARAYVPPTPGIAS